MSDDDKYNEINCQINLSVNVNSIKLLLVLRLINFIDHMST